MLTLNRSILYREYNLMNVLKALSSIVPICSIHVIHLSKIVPRYLTLWEPPTKQFYRKCQSPTVLPSNQSTWRIAELH
jgi:hypothetical protein